MNAISIAAEMGVTIELRDLTPTLLGLTVNRDRIVLNRHLRGKEREFTIAHELGHVALLRAGQRWMQPDVEENYADAYARRLLGLIAVRCSRREE